MNSLTVNLHLMMVSFYRPTAGRWKILMEESAFPSDQYAVESHLRSRGLDPDEGVLVARPRAAKSMLRIEDLEALCRTGAGDCLVLLPGVQYFTGQLLDMERHLQAAHAAGCDCRLRPGPRGRQCDASLHDWNVDFAVWCSYKYLNAGPGAVAGCFVHERHGSDLAVPRLRRLVGQRSRNPVPDAPQRSTSCPCPAPPAGSSAIRRSSPWRRWGLPWSSSTGRGCLPCGQDPSGSPDIWRSCFRISPPTGSGCSPPRDPGSAGLPAVAAIKCPRALVSSPMS